MISMVSLSREKIVGNENREKGLTICSPSEIVCFLILGSRPDFPGMFSYALLRS